MSFLHNLHDGILLSGYRFEIRYNKIGDPFEKSKILWESDYHEDYTNQELYEVEARKKFDDILGKGKLYNMAKGIKAPKGTFSELFLVKACGQIESGIGFHSFAYYTLKRGTVPFTAIKVWI